jgi:hypothetical protein
MSLIHISKQDAEQTAHDTAIFGFPLVIMEITRRAAANFPMGQMSPMREFPDATFNAIVAPNADTLYIGGWADAGSEPYILSVPDTKGRYYLMPIYNCWTDAFASPGTRTTGTGAGDFAITGPGWNGKLPDGIKEFRSSTRYACIIGRIACNGPSDYENVWKIQDKIKLTPLSEWGINPIQPATLPADLPVNEGLPPLDQMRAMDAITFFNNMCRLMLDNPPYDRDAGAMQNFRKIGVAPGADFTAYFSELEKDAKEAIVAGYKSAIIDIPRFFTGQIKNGWRMGSGQGDFGTDYGMRARTAYAGLFANTVEDSFYAASIAMEDGQKYSSENTYVLHFDRHQVPPVHGFWSLTLYDSKIAFAANPINRYKVGSLSEPALNANTDGGYDLYIQRNSPGADKEANWLPAPESGRFSLALRLYWPTDEVLNKSWVPPAVQMAP